MATHNTIPLFAAALLARMAVVEGNAHGQVPDIKDAAPTTKVPAGKIEGSDSSLARAGIDATVSLQPSPSAENKGSVRELLDRQARKDNRYVPQEEIAAGGMGTIPRAGASLSDLHGLEGLPFTILRSRSYTAREFWKKYDAGEIN